MTVIITPKKMDETLDWLVETYGPDYTYSRPVNEEGVPGKCKYVHNGEGSCLMGKAFIRLGVDVEEMSQHEGRGVATVLTSLILDGIVEVDASDRDFRRMEHMLAVAQLNQDSNRPWGEALLTARNNVTLHIREGGL